MQSVTFIKNGVDKKDVIARIDNVTEEEYKSIIEKVKEGLKNDDLNVTFEKGNILTKRDIEKNIGRDMDLINAYVKNEVKFNIKKTLLILSLFSTFLSFIFQVSEDITTYKVFINISMILIATACVLVFSDFFKNNLKDMLKRKK